MIFTLLNNFLSLLDNFSVWTFDLYLCWTKLRRKTVYISTLCWIKHRGPSELGSLCLSFFLSLSQSNSLEHRSPLSSLSCSGLQDPRERVPCAYVKQCKPLVKSFIAFLHKPRNISLFLSLFYFLIVDSRPPGSSTLKDLNKPPFEILLLS